MASNNTESIGHQRALSLRDKRRRRKKKEDIALIFIR